jgi:hypothetical protein
VRSVRVSGRRVQANLLGAASPGRLTTRQGTRAEAPVKAAATARERQPVAVAEGVALMGCRRVPGSEGAGGAAASGVLHARHLSERAGEAPREATMRPRVWGSAPAAATAAACVASTHLASVQLSKRRQWTGATGGTVRRGDVHRRFTRAETV